MKNHRPLSPALLRVGWRYLARSPWQSLLMVVGIMLGVAVVVGVDLANQSAAKAFDLSTDSIAGKATHLITGGPQGLNQEIYTTLRVAGLPYPSAPVITEYVSSPQMGDIPFQLLGLDPFAEPPFRDYLNGSGSVPLADLTRFLTQPGAILLSADVADRFGLQVGDSLPLNINGQTQTAHLVGLLHPADDLSRRALDGLILTDIASAQEFTGRLSALDNIDLILPEDDLGAVATVENLLPVGAVLQPVAARSGAVEQMTAAFRTNLTALSLLALVVGVFLIYNTMTFSVIQRRPLFGTLRCLGVTRAQVFALVVVEAFIVGTVGSLLGVALGLLLGRGAVGLVAQTINDLFFVLTVQDVAVPYTSIAKGALLGIAATVAAAAVPAWEAASVPPRAALIRSGIESKAQNVIRLVAWVGLGIIALGIGLLLIPTRSLVVSFGGTFTIVIGFALLTPQVTCFLMGWLTPLTSRLWGPLGRMAPREVVNAISRTSVAMAALMIAISVSIGVSVMVGSFRLTVINWMEQILSGDIYVSPTADTSFDLTSATIDPQAVDLFRDWPGVARADLLRSVIVDSPQGPISLGANNNPLDGEEQIYLAADGPPLEIWEQVQDGAILISEPLARRLGLPLEGGQLTLYTDRGPHTFPVVGVYYDYSSSQGSAILWLDVYRQYWDDDAITAISLKLDPDLDLDSTVIDLQEASVPIQSLLIRPNRELRADTLEIFDRTFAITGALQLLATVVAFVGVLSAMLSLQLEKQRQLGILRAIGLTVGQLWRLVLLETGLMGAVAGLLAMPTGYVLSLILVYIINRRSFGWTLQMELIPLPFIQALLVALGAALLAGLYPARRLSRRVTADATRFD